MQSEPTTYFYAPPEQFRDGYVHLPDEEAHHAARVLRHRPGDEVVVVDGVGGWYRVALDHVDRRRATGLVVEHRREVGEPPYRLTLGLALLKHRGRYETFLEKAVELGAARIVPLLTERTEKERIRETRAQNILLAALKQTRRSRLVALDEPTDLDEAVAQYRGDLLLVCHEAVGTEHSLLGILGAHPEARDITVLVGPEGGFTDAEVEAVQEAGGVVASLGPRRLRAETAALAAAAGVMLGRG